MKWQAVASSCEDQLRSALAAGDFAEAQRLLPAYSEEIVTLLSAPLSRQECQQAIEAFHTLLSLARVMRAHMSAQLSTLERQSCYNYHIPSPDKHSWLFEG